MKVAIFVCLFALLSCASEKPKPAEPCPLWGEGKWGEAKHTECPNGEKK